MAYTSYLKGDLSSGITPEDWSIPIFDFMNVYYLLILSILCSFSTSAQDRTVGVFLNDSSAFNGYTLFSPVPDRNTYLIDNCGRLVNKWTFNSVPGMMAYLHDDGSVFRAGRIMSGFGAGGSGGLIEKKSWDDELLWSISYSTDSLKQHHDISVMPNGNILLIAWEKRSVPETVQAGRIPESIGSNGIWFEQVVELKPIGSDSAEIVWEWHLFDHLVQDRDSSLNNFGIIHENPGRLNTNFQAFNPANPTIPGNADWIHLNSIDYNVQEDLILLSSRNTSEIYVIDHSTSSEEAATSQGGRFGRGGDFIFRWGNPMVYNSGSEADRLLYSQHDAAWIRENGVETDEISIFNNGLNRDFENTSSVEIIHPDFDIEGYRIDSLTNQYVLRDHISFFADQELNFSSARLSGAQILENGNLLISSGNNGTVYEVNFDRDVLWQYINPVSQIGPVSQGSDPFLNDIFRAVRYPESFAAFNNRDLTPGEVLELDSPFSDCVIYSDETSSTKSSLDFSELLVYPNPATDRLNIEMYEKPEIQYRIFKINGELMGKGYLNAGEIDISELDAGVYILKILDENTQGYFKFLKL